MAPVVIDLTSSPEPEDTSARATALASFQPRKQKQRNASTAAIAEDELPGFYDYVKKDDSHYGHGLSEAQNPSIGTRAGTTTALTGSFAPTTSRHHGHDNLRTAQPAALSTTGFNRTLHAPTHGLPHATSLTTRNLEPKANALRQPAYEGTRPSMNGSHVASKTAAQANLSNGYSNQPRSGGGHQTVNGAQSGFQSNGNFQHRSPIQDRTAASHARVVDIAQPLDGLSQQSLARLHGQRDDPAVADSPLGPLARAILPEVLGKTSVQDGQAAGSAFRPSMQRQAPSGEKRYPCPMAQRTGCSDMFTIPYHAERHALIHKGQKNHICPKCEKPFLRKDNMNTHYQRCKARTSGVPSRSTVNGQNRPSNRPTATADPILAPTISQSVPAAEPAFNALKRPLSPSPPGDNCGGSTGAAKRTRIDLTTPPRSSTTHQGRQPVLNGFHAPKATSLQNGLSDRSSKQRVLGNVHQSANSNQLDFRQQPRQGPFQLTDVTDHARDSFVQSDGSKVQSPEPARPESRLESSSTDIRQPSPADDLSSGPDMRGERYSAAEDALLRKLREVYRLPWEAIVGRFNGRTQGSLTVHYYDLQKKDAGPSRQIRSAPLELRSQAPTKRIRTSTKAEGMVSWQEIKQSSLEQSRVEEVQRQQRERKRRREQSWLPPAELDFETISTQDSVPEEDDSNPGVMPRDSAFPSSMSRILRLRELGVHGTRAWSGSSHPVPDELKDHVFSDYGLHQYFHGASGDINSLTWNHQGRFAAGSIAVADPGSMQYNMHRNLLVGDTNRGELEELLHHHIPRPVIADAKNINASHAMRESQDPRLFLTVNAASFCPQDDTRLFTAARDETLRYFTVEDCEVRHRYAIKHPASVDLLSIGTGNRLVATGCHLPTNSINVFQCNPDSYEIKLQLSARNSGAPIFPSALRWGVAPQHRNFLLAGFSSEEELASSTTGETCLWDVPTATPIHLSGISRNIFDVAWNPIPASSSIAFAVAGSSHGHVVDKGMRSLIQCFAGERSVLSWQCPALDINDLIFCPYDDNLIAAGATNGRVYIWDKRSADRSQRPLHTLRHGESLNVLDHDRPTEMADTGVRFLSWGSTKNRLYTGSSDGIVKIWNPYRSPGNAHIEDISGPTQHNSAVMSGAFSPDFSELLIGTENGRINLFKSGTGSEACQPKQFKLIPGPEPKKEQQEPFIAARELLKTGQIEIEPAGAMPFRQAVQGPNYAGPYLKPSKKERREASECLDQALIRQTTLGVESDEAEVKSATADLDFAESVVRDLQEKKKLAEFLKPDAMVFQRNLAAAETARVELEALVGKVEQCSLDCGVLSLPEEDKDEGVEDSGRSEGRIPSLLGRVEDVGVEECWGCFPMKERERGEKRFFCGSCRLRKRLVAVCGVCGEAAIPQLQEGKGAVCERCAFGCFRCGKEGVVSENGKSVSCGACGLEWEVGVLGSELVGQKTSAKVDLGMGKGKADDDDDEMVEFGNQDMEFYAGRWIMPGMASHRTDG